MTWIPGALVARSTPTRLIRGAETGSPLMTAFPAPPPPDWDNQPIKVVVEQTGRWTYLVYITHGLMRFGPGGYGWIVLGEKRAKRKAAKKLRNYLRREQYPRDVWTMTKPDPEDH